VSKLTPTRGVYDLAGVEGAAGPVQFFGALSALACVLAGSASFDYVPFGIWGAVVLAVAHGMSLALRVREVPLERRFLAGLALAVSVIALTLVVPPLRAAGISPDMQGDSDYQLGGVLVWIALIGQCFASAPGALIFALVPELAALAVFGQINVTIELPACYALYLLAALGLLTYSNFLRRPFGMRVRRNRVVPRASDIAFGVAVLFVGLCVVGGALAVILRVVLPSPFASPWFTRHFFQAAATASGAFEDFSDELDLTRGSSSLGAVPVLSVRSPRPLLLRRRVYTRYSGHGWLPSHARASSRSFLAESGEVPRTVVEGRPDAEGEAFRHQVVLRQALPTTLPVAGLATTVAVSDRDPRDLVQIDSEGVVWVRSLPAGAVATVESVECLEGSEGLDAYGADYGASLVTSSPYLQVTEEAAQLRDLALDITRDARTVRERVEAIERYVEAEFTYNTSAPPPDPDADSVVDFVLRRKQGVCTDLASTMAVLCRLNGIPCRLVTGYAASEPDPSEPGAFLVREKDAHAWVEVLYAGMGWVTYDPQTERAVTESPWESVAPRVRRAVSAVVAVLRRNILPLALMAPVLYIVLYELRRRGVRMRSSRREGVGRGLAALTRALQPWSGWAPPGRTPWQVMSAALPAIPVELHRDLRLAMAALVGLRYGKEEPGPDEVRRALWAVRTLCRRLREAARRRRARVGSSQAS